MVKFIECFIVLLLGVRWFDGLSYWKFIKLNVLLVRLVEFVVFEVCVVVLGEVVKAVLV